MKYLLVLLPFLPSIAHAAGTGGTYTLLAPLSGYLTGAPDLTTYLQGFVQMAIGIAGVLAVIMIVYCGVQLMGTPSASGKSEAKECIWNAISGVLLALGAWGLLYTINPLLLTSELNLTEVVVAPGGMVSSTIPPGNYRWSASSTCTPVAGKIVAAVPPSYCTGAAPSGTSVCCSAVDSPLRQRTGTPVVAEPPPIVTTESTTKTMSNFSAPLYAVNNNAGEIVITVTRSSGEGLGSVDYSTKGAGAAPEIDYTDVSGTLNFSEGVTEKTFRIPIIDNSQPGGRKNIAVSLTNPTGAVSLGATANTLVRIIDNSLPPPSDTIPPTINISSPEDGQIALSGNVPITFTASDDTLIKRLEYIYAPPSSGKADPTIICDSSCPSPEAAMTVPVTIDTTLPGIHTITIRACDGGQCSSQQVTVEIETPCTTNSFTVCKTLPTGKATTTPLCAPKSGTPSITVGTNTHAYAFKITSGVGGTIHLVGGAQKEYPPPEYVARSCGARGQCFDGSDGRYCRCYGDNDGSNDEYDTYACPVNILPANIVASISNTPGDISSTPTTPWRREKRVSGYCGNGGAIGGANLTFTLSTNASGANICSIEKNRTYYLNVTTVPFVAGGNPLYSLFWDFAP